MGNPECHDVLVAIGKFHGLIEYAAQSGKGLTVSHDDAHQIGDMLRDLIDQIELKRDEIERLTAEVNELQTVANYARDFIEQYKAVIQSDEYRGIWVFLNAHNNEYKGPIFRDPEYLISALERVSGSPKPKGDKA